MNAKNLKGNIQRPPGALMLVLVLVGFLLVVAGTATSVANQNDQPRKQALISQIVDQQQNVEDLDQAVNQLRAQLSDARKQAGVASGHQAARNAVEDQLSMDAGTTAIKGPGITVKLSDSPQAAGSTKFDANRIQDADIQLIVNALFAIGAEAVAINDNRVSSVTPIRAAGGTIVVNYRPTNSPYRIVAIGADKKRFNSTDIAEHFRQWKKKFDLGYSINDDDNLKVPAYAGRVSIDIAEPVTESN